MGKFDNKEATSSTIKSKSAAKSMGAPKKAEKKLVSFQAAPEMYSKFSYINDQLGLSNTAAINILIADYVKQHADMI